MITTAILNILWFVLLLVTSPLRLLADAYLDPSIAASVAEAGSWFAIINSFAPLSSVLAIGAAFLSIEAGIFLWKTTSWLIRKIPGIS